MRPRTLLSIATVLATACVTLGQTPVFSTTLNDLASITATGGVNNNGGVFVPTSFPAFSVNKYQSTGNSTASWGRTQTQAIFAGWDNSQGITVDLYFSGIGEGGVGSDGDVGLWSVGKRLGGDNFLILVARVDEFRFNIRDTGGAGNIGGGTHTILTTGVDLNPATTYRLTVRQHSSLGTNGDLQIFLESISDGGAQYPANQPPIRSLTLTGGNFGFPVDVGAGTDALGMRIGDKYPLFGGSGFQLENGDAVDEVRVYNGSFTPAQLDAGGLPTPVISADVTSGIVPFMVDFDGSGSFDEPPGTIVSWEWDFEGNGGAPDSTLENPPPFTYTSPGTFNATLTVTDNNANSISASVPIMALPPPAAGVVPVTALLPAGGPLTGRQEVESITAGGNTFTDLVGPTAVELIPGANEFSNAQNTGLCSAGADVGRNLLGLELGRAVLGLSDPGQESIRAFFPAAVNGDGTGKPEIFVLEYAGSRDTFQIQLLTSGPGDAPVIAATVQILNVNYTGTSTVMSALTPGQAVGGVGVDLDALGVSGIRGVQIPADNGSGGDSGLDPCTIAAVAGPADMFAPVADAEAGPTTGGFPLFVSFTACGSYDPDGQDLTYAWDFENDGFDDAVGENVTHTYPTGGVFTAKLTVTDADTLISTDTVVINVDGPNPKRRITAFTADNLGGGSLLLTSVTTVFPNGSPSFVATDLSGPPDTQTNPPAYDYIDVFGNMDASGIATAPDQAMVGLELGSYVTSLSTPGEFLRGYFADDVVINPDGTDAPEVFVLENTATTDNFQIQLLSNGRTEGVTVAATVQVYAGDYTNVASTRGGMGIDLDALNVSGIRGVQLPGADGLGGGTGLDPSVIAAVAVSCNVPFADADGDGDVDQMDFAALQLCVTGNGDPQGVFNATACFCFDRGADSDIDAFDVEDFRDCATGPGVPWSQPLTPNCNP